MAFVLTVYYTTTSVLLWLTLAVLCILAHEDDRIRKADKRLYYLTYATIGLALLAEWAGLGLGSSKDSPAWAVQTAKCFDYILTPLAGGALVAQMHIRNRWTRTLILILIGNTIFQIVALFTGWMVAVDGKGQYTHGPLYGIYIAVYVAIIAIVFVQFLLFGRSFRKQNRLSLYATACLIAAGVLMQELFGSQTRTAYIALTIGAALLYIHFTEFSQQRTDATVARLKNQVTTDALTGLLSRHAYAHKLESLSDATPPQGFVVFSIDVNGLKDVNDTLGHDAGDELLCGAAQCIKRAMGKDAKCYRTGGDEFVVFATMDWMQAEEALGRLQDETDRWRGSTVHSLSVSAGYALASDYKDLTCAELLQKSDYAMYSAKTAYYRQTGKRRRA